MQMYRVQTQLISLLTQLPAAEALCMCVCLNKKLINNRKTAEKTGERGISKLTYPVYISSAAAGMHFKCANVKLMVYST